MHDISEENLWLLCLNGDRDAFKEMYCRFYSLLYYYGLKLVSDKELVKKYWIEAVTCDGDVADREAEVMVMMAENCNIDISNMTI